MSATKNSTKTKIDLDSSFPKGLKARAEAFLPELEFTNEGILQENEVPEWWLNVEFSTEETEIFLGRRTDACRKVAKLELRIRKYSDIDQMLLIADMEADDMDSAESARAYMEKSCIEGQDGFFVCKMHTFYISPEYRGMGISKLCYAFIPRLLSSNLNIDSAIVTACVNPYANQESLNASDFEPGGYIMADSKTPEANRVIKTAAMALERAGFTAVDKTKKRYAASTDALRSEAEKDAVLRDFYTA